MKRLQFNSFNLHIRIYCCNFDISFKKIRESLSLTSSWFLYKPPDYDPNKEAKSNFFDMLADFRRDTPDLLIDLFKTCLNFNTKLRPKFQAVN